MLQYYLKDEGLNLSWVGTGRLSFSLDYQRVDMDKITDKIINACRRMEEDGWWGVEYAPSKLAIQIDLVKEILMGLGKRAFSIS